MADLRRDFDYNLRLLEGRDEALAAAEAAAEAAAQDASTLRGEAARLADALQKAEQGTLGVSCQPGYLMRGSVGRMSQSLIPLALLTPALC